KLIAVADEEGHVGVWDLSKKEFRRKKVSEKPLTSIAFSDDGKGLLVGDAGGEASVWFSDLSGPRQRCRPPKQRELPLKRVLFGAREREVLTCAETAVVSRYKADNGEYVADLASLDSKRTLFDAAVRPGADQLLVIVEAGGGSSGNDLILLDVYRGQQVLSF